MASYMDKTGFTHFWQNIVKPKLESFVEKIEGKGLSENDFTDEYVDKINSLENNVTALQDTKVSKVTGKGLSSNDFTTEYKNQIDMNKSDIAALDNKKVDKVTGKGLSSNDFTDAYIAKIANLEATFDTLAKTGTLWESIEDSSGSAITDSSGNEMEGRVVFKRL